VALLLVILMTINDPVRERLSSQLSVRPANVISELGEQAASLVSSVTSLLRDVTMDHTPIVAFTTVGAVLLLAMLRD
jgi:hypothetical protein